MTEENEGYLQAMERDPEMTLRNQRIHLNILERNSLYFSDDQWKRYLALSERFRKEIVAIYPGLGS